jgi:radical SAM protein with 4Fe4S-binding SPASM domain
MRLPVSGVIVFSVAEHCNASCDYCYLRHSKDKPAGLLPQTDIEVIFGRYCRELKKAGILGSGIFWHGGDALNINPDWLDMAVMTVNDVFAGYGIDVRHAMQTNLMRYDADRKVVLQKHFSVGMGSSLDYPNMHRKFGKLTGDDYNNHWIKNYRALKDDGLTVSTIAVANRQTLRTKPREFCDYFHKHVGIDGMQINFPFGGDFWLDPTDLGEWLLRLLDIWYAEMNFHQISPFGNLYRRIHWDRGQMFYDGMCVLDADCTRGVIGIGPTGRVSQCDTWRGDTICDDFGNLLDTSSIESILDHPARREISERWKTLSECIRCEWFRICGGGCPRRALEAHGTINRKDPYCETYKMLFSAIAERRHPVFDKRANAMYHVSSPDPNRSAILGGKQCSVA